MVKNLIQKDMNSIIKNVSLKIQNNLVIQKIKNMNIFTDRRIYNSEEWYRNKISEQTEICLKAQNRINEIKNQIKIEEELALVQEEIKNLKEQRKNKFGY